MTSSLTRAIGCAVVAGALLSPMHCGAGPQTDHKTLADAQRLFYNAHYEESAALARVPARVRAGTTSRTTRCGRRLSCSCCAVY